MPAPKTIVPSGYQIDLDRQPPTAGGGCSGSMVYGLSFLIALVGGAIILARSVLGGTPTQPATPPTLQELAIVGTLTPAPTNSEAFPTLDDWSLTGTALVFVAASPTPDYCFWLTPTSTPVPTLIYTPDAWQATGTALYLATNPPQTATPTPDYPRAWCNNIPTNTPTMTPLALNRMATDEISPTFTPTMTPLSLNSVESVASAQTVQQQPPVSVGVAEWDIILPTVGPPYVGTPTDTRTPKPPKPTQTPVIIIVTATPTHTLDITPELTSEPTTEPTPEATPNA